MRKPYPLILLAVLLSSYALSARPIDRSGAREKPIPRIDYAPSYSLDGGDLLAFAHQDTYLLAEYEFDSGSRPDYQGWQGEDRTGQSGNFWQVETYRAVSGTQSMWCGARPGSGDPLCLYATLPGYGNLWDQTLESTDFQVGGPVTVTFGARYDSEAGYDSTVFSYSTDGGNTWNRLRGYQGTNDLLYDTVTVDASLHSGSIRFRFRFTSDGAWSDQDGLYDSQGAFILDDVTVSDGGGIVDFQDFESEPVGAHETADSDWRGYPHPGYGDFSGLFRGMVVLQEDACTSDPSYLWGFFEGSTYDYGWGGHPEQPVVPYGDERGQYLYNAVYSPLIEWNPGGVVPPTATKVVFDFLVYRDLPLDNLVFYTFEVKPYANGCPLDDWIHRDFVYYGAEKEWLRQKMEFGDLIPAGTTHIRLALICRDMCRYWCGVYGTGQYHSHAPLFDRVKFYRIDSTGPIWWVRDIDLFQDNFPEDGTITGTVRIDMARDIMPEDSPAIRPGDSLLVYVNEPNYGLGTAPDGRAAVYCYVRSSSGGSPTDWEAPEAGLAVPKRFPYIGSGPTAGGFYKFQMDNVYYGDTILVQDRFCFDLNDDYFHPGDRIDFYFASEDGRGVTSYWSEFTGTTLDQAEVESAPMEVQCLPTGSSELLYVDDYDGLGAQPYFDSAFEMLGIQPDRYDVRGPSSLVGNGLGSRASAAQVESAYRAIIWNSGDLPSGTIGDGSGPEKSPSAQLLYGFLNGSAWNPGLYISGDDVAEEMKTLGTPPYQDLFTFIGYNLTNGDHRAYGLPVSPRAIGLETGTIFRHAGPPARTDSTIVMAGCPRITDLDVLEPTGSTAMEMHYGEDPSAGAVLSRETTNSHGKTARVVLSGFSFHHMRDDAAGFPPDRVDHLMHILQWFESPVSGPTGAEEAVPSDALFQNHPNPFNPATRIRFSIGTRARARLAVFDVSGRLVKVLKDEELPPGAYEVAWDGRNARGERVASGVYFYRLRAGRFCGARKMVLLW